MTDGHVDMRGLVVHVGNRIQRRDRATLHDEELAIGDAPLDVLRAAEVRFDSPAESLELDDLPVRQRLVVLTLGFDRAFVRAAALHGKSHQLLRRDLLVDDRAVAHAIRVGVHEAGD